jgi:diacylglycerol diphosphate phosphatase / phosphatidate phosphatase
MHELRASVCAILVSIGLSEGVTQTLKLYVQRHRPCFYALCGFDPATLKCTAPLSKVHEASLSFPSGHSSLSFCAMTFLAYFLLGRLSRMTNTTCSTIPGQQRATIKLWPYKSLLGVLAIVVPCSYATFVATSRIVDNWHHPSDIIAGTFLGIASATIGYHAFYPSTTAVNAGIPLSLQSQQQQQQSSS